VIKSHEQMSICKIEVGQSLCQVLVIERPETAEYLKEGSDVSLIFNETQVVLCKEQLTDCSLTNGFRSSIERVEKGTLLTRVFFNVQAFEIRALILTEANMDLEVGSTIYAYVRANEIMMASE